MKECARRHCVFGATQMQDRLNMRRFSGRILKIVHTPSVHPSVWTARCGLPHRHGVVWLDQPALQKPAQQYRGQVLKVYCVEFFINFRFSEVSGMSFLQLFLCLLSSFVSCCLWSPLPQKSITDRTEWNRHYDNVQYFSLYWPGAALLLLWH